MFVFWLLESGDCDKICLTGLILRYDSKMKQHIHTENAAGLGEWSKDYIVD